MSDIRTEFSGLDGAIRDYIEDLVAFSARKPSDSPYTEEQGEKDIRMYQDLAREGYAKVEKTLSEVIRSLPNWSGIDLRLEPLWDKREGPIIWSDDDVRIGTTANVLLGRGSNAPGFTLFTDPSGDVQGVDDVLDAGDSDFFNDPSIEADYYMLVEELRHPGGARKLGNKVITLYTARPIKDRKIYEHAKAIPTNVFLTTSEDEAFGYVQDLGGNRDVYRVRIKRMYLVETLDVGSKKNYQTYASGERMVPVEDCLMIYEGQKLARKVLARFLRNLRSVA